MSDHSLWWTKTLWMSVLINKDWAVWKSHHFKSAWYYNDYKKPDCYKGARGPFETRTAAIKAAEAEGAGND